MHFKREYNDLVVGVRKLLHRDVVYMKIMLRPALVSVGLLHKKAVPLGQESGSCRSALCISGKQAKICFLVREMHHIRSNKLIKTQDVYDYMYFKAA